MNSPISLLSTDVLILIVNHLLIGDAASTNDPDNACGREDNNILDFNRIIRRASQVSRFWRSVCLGNPLWWSRIYIAHPWHLEDVKLRLKRSQQCPLDLRILGKLTTTKPTRISISSNTSRSTPTIHSALFKLVFPVLERCQVLHIRGLFTGDGQRILSFRDLEDMADAPMPILQELIVEEDLEIYDDAIAQSGRGPLFASTPNLQKLRLIGADLNRFQFSSPGPSSPLNSPPSNALPSYALTALHISGASDTRHRTRITITTQQLVHLLSSCPLLTILAIYHDIGFDTTGPSMVSGTCTAPSLKSLYLFSSRKSLLKILTVFHAPQMTELIIAPIIDLPEFWELPKPDQFPKLTSLTIAPTWDSTKSGVTMPPCMKASYCFPFIERIIMPITFMEKLGRISYCLSSEYIIDGVRTFLFPRLREVAFHVDGVGDMELNLSKLSRSESQFLSSLSKTVNSIRHSRFRIAGVHLDNVFVDKTTFHVFKYGAVEMPDVKCANFWEAQKRKTLLPQFQELSLGTKPLDSNLNWDDGIIE